MSTAHVRHSDARASLTRKAALASVGMAIILAGLKFWAAIQTHSVAMLGSLADTGLDLLASLVTLYAVQLAAEPADDEHGFGHGKAEALAALFQAGLVTASAIAIGWRAISRLGSEQSPEHPELGIAVSGFALLLTLALVAYQRMVVRKTGSLAIQADHVHYSSDILLNASVIAALALEAWGGLRGADPVFGIGIAAWLAFQAYGVARSAVDQLMDREWPQDKLDRFTTLAGTHAAVHGIHDLRTRSSGAHDFAQFHIWVDPSMSIAEAHRVMDEVEADLLKAFPGTVILIHPDPLGHADPARGEAPAG